MTDLDQLSAAATQGEWFYRPQKYDDLGVIRGEMMEDGHYGFPVAISRAGGPVELVADPYEPNGRYIVALVNKHRSGDLIPLAAHEAAIEAAVLAERERCASIAEMEGAKAEECKGDLIAQIYCDDVANLVRYPEVTP